MNRSLSDEYRVHKIHISISSPGTDFFPKFANRLRNKALKPYETPRSAAAAFGLSDK